MGRHLNDKTLAAGNGH